MDALSFDLCSSVTLNGRVSGSTALGSVRVSDHVLKVSSQDLLSVSET